jgi:hypothetical protein
MGNKSCRGGSGVAGNAKTITAETLAAKNDHAIRQSEGIGFSGGTPVVNHRPAKWLDKTG